MAFRTINLTFGGLCLLVPQFDDLKNLIAVHCLLPATGEGPQGGFGTRVDVHLCRLYYDAAHNRGTAISGTPVEVKLDDIFIQIPNISSTKLEPPPAAVPNAGSVANRAVPSKYLNLATNNRVLARVSFTAGKAWVPTGAEGACWTYGGSTLRLPIRVQWSLEVADLTEVNLELRGMNDTAGGPVLKLLPATDSTELNLWVFNSPIKEIREIRKRLPPPINTVDRPSKGDPAEHFAAFYDLVGAEVPIYHSFDECVASPEPDHQTLRFGGAAAAVPGAAASRQGSEVTCTVAQAFLGK